MAPDSHVELLATLGRRRPWSVDVIRVTAGGRATRRQSLFDSAVLTRLSRSGVASLVARLRPSFRRDERVAEGTGIGQNLG
jgi:hypothetical protein